MKIYLERKSNMKKFYFYYSIIFLSIIIAFIFNSFSNLCVEHGRKLQIEEDYHISNYFKKELEKAKKQLQVYEKAIHIIENESSMRHNVKGKHGEYGIAQFKKKTFLELKEKSGIKNIQWENPVHQFQLLCWAIENGYESLWTTAK